MLKQQFAQTLIQDGVSATIDEGETTSSLLTCGGGSPRNIYIPSNWTSCNISFQTSPTPNGPFYTKSNVDGSPLSIPTVASMDLPLLAYLFDATPYVRIVCSVAQAEDVELIFGLQPIYQGIHG